MRRAKHLTMSQATLIKSRLALANKHYDDLINELKERGYKRARSTISRTIHGQTYNAKLKGLIEEILSTWGV